MPLDRLVRGSVMSRTSLTLPHGIKNSSRSRGRIRFDNCIQNTVLTSLSSGVSSGDRTRFGGVREYERLCRRVSRDFDLRRLDEDLSRRLCRSSRLWLRRRRSRSRDLDLSRLDFFDRDRDLDLEQRLCRRSRLLSLLRLRLFLRLLFFLLSKIK